MKRREHADNEILLDGTWELRDEEIKCGPDDAGQILKRRRGWISTPVPGDVRQGLIAAGRMKEPTIGLNSFEGHWVEDRSWWFRKTFTGTSQMLNADRVELELDGLDVNASVFLNGVHLGDHPSAFRPFVVGIDNGLLKKENILLVRLTSGTETVPEEDLESFKGIIQCSASRPERGDRRRVFLRKPQYTWGWDWAPRVATVAIANSVRLRILNKAAIRDVQIVCTPDGKNVDMNACVAVEWLNWRREGKGTIKLTVTDPNGKTVGKQSVSTLLQSGQNYIDLSMLIRNAKLWWPVGMGRQDRYTVSVELQTGGRRVRLPDFEYGIRFVELNTHNTFAFSINGVEMFCRGGNWCPPDSVYARVTDEKIEKLIMEAKAANFNMIRVWGGARYKRDAFYEICDREGILIWHDFMFACSVYPDHLEAFRDEVAKEADYQTRRLRNHACIVLWCGSNENLNCMHIGKPNESSRGTVLMGHVLPSVVRRNCGDTPYWYCSPYGGKLPRYHSAGNSHYWDIGMSGKMSGRITPERYDKCRASFVTEFGYIGPCCERTTATYLDGAPSDRSDKVWYHHSNTFEKNTVEAGIKKHYVDPDKLTSETYLLYAGLTHGMMLGYALEALRAKPACHGGMFWAYNDCWGEVGWSVMDYYLRRKIAWYFVRRALAFRRLIMRSDGNNVTVTLANDAQRDAKGLLEYGYVSLDGKDRRMTKKAFSAPAAARTVLATFSKGKCDPKQGLWYARTNVRDVLPATLKAVDFRELETVSPTLNVSVSAAGCNSYHVGIRSNKYAHAVRLELPDGAVPEDNFFDLLPGERRTVKVFSPRQCLGQENVAAVATMA